MSTKVQGAAPWTREAVRQFAFRHPDDLARIEAAIGEGEHITIICGRSPRPLGAWYRGIRVEPVHPTVSAACWAAIEAARVAEAVA